MLKFCHDIIHFFPALLYHFNLFSHLQGPEGIKHLWIQLISLCQLTIALWLVLWHSVIKRSSEQHLKNNSLTKILIQIKMVNSNMSEVICKHFNTGICKYRSRCRYKHPIKREQGSKSILDPCVYLENKSHF